jgi:adenylate cyclase
MVYGALRDHVEAGFEDGGEHIVKNIARPVRAYTVRGAHDLVVEPKGDVKSSTLVREMDLPLPNRPSIAVLPFTNMSGDPEQEYFADGVTDEITTELSRFHSLFVIARNSSFTYKCKAVDVRVVAKELGVRYVLEGSIRSQRALRRTPLPRRLPRPSVAATRTR